MHWHCEFVFNRLSVLQLALEEAIQTYLRKQEAGEPIDLKYVADEVLELSATLATQRDQRLKEGEELGYTPDV